MKTKTLLLLCLLLVFSVTRLSAQTLKKGAVCGIHTFTLNINPDATLNQVIDLFLNKYIPEVEKNFPGTKVYLLSGDRGENINKLALMTVFESVAVRDKYYPGSDKTSPESDAANEKVVAAIGDVSNILLSYTTIYTDWIVK
ncbi:MAG: hypothetical protein NTW82_07595 [Bacteroidia bacterium]|nr:hypothetical protein [Bacteroidia bacterium]